MLPAWIYGIVLTVVSTASSYDRLYPTEADRAQVAASAEHRRAAGDHRPGVRPDHGRRADRLADRRDRRRCWPALMSLLLVVRHTRAEEEAGRTELVGAAAVGRYAVPVAGFLVAVVANVSIALLSAAGLIAVGLPVAGSFALGLAIGAAGLVFARGRAGDRAGRRRWPGPRPGRPGRCSGWPTCCGRSATPAPSWLSWLSPIGWAQQVRAFAGERWWVFALPLLLTAGLVGAAAVLLPRRDLGAGLRPAAAGTAGGRAAAGRAARAGLAAAAGRAARLDRRLPDRRRGGRRGRQRRAATCSATARRPRS